MRVVDIIEKKRNGMPLSDSEIGFIVTEYTQGRLPDYQMSALLMAIYFQGMTDAETAALTLAMARSGRQVDLSGIPGIKVDKHSTGGVADTTTLVLAPLVASAGVPVAKMSGRGLGFTGGTIDKLESVPGFRTGLSHAEFVETISRHGLAVMGQTPDIAPADGKIYALRDVTATVESIPLIASSIMSKKIAAGADRILLDVKVGSGAFMHDLNDAVKLAQAMVRIGLMVGRQTKAVITSMDQPLGFAIGNSLEVREAIEVLSNQQPGSCLTEVCLTLGALMLVMAGAAQTEAAARNRLAGYIADGTALQKFTEFLAAQGGNPAVVHDFSLLPQPGVSAIVRAGKTGYIRMINAAEIGQCATALGAGRSYKGQRIDLSAGMILTCRLGDRVEAGQPIAELFAATEENFSQVSQRLQSAIAIGDMLPEVKPLILGRVDEIGFHEGLTDQ